MTVSGVWVPVCKRNIALYETHSLALCIIISQRSNADGILATCSWSGVDVSIMGNDCEQ